MSKIKNTFSLAASSWSVLKADKALLVLPLLSGIASIIVALSFLFPLFLTGGTTEDPTPLTYVVLFAMYIALAFVTIFFNTALVSSAYERLRGGDPTSPARSAERSPSSDASCHGPSPPRPCRS